MQVWTCPESQPEDPGWARRLGTELGQELPLPGPGCTRPVGVPGQRPGRLSAGLCPANLDHLSASALTVWQQQLLL